MNFNLLYSRMNVFISNTVKVVAIAGDSLFYKGFDLNQTMQCYLDTVNTGTSQTASYVCLVGHFHNDLGIRTLDPLNFFK